LASFSSKTSANSESWSGISTGVDGYFGGTSDISRIYEYRSFITVTD